MRILLATTNPHKIEEVRSILAPVGIEVIGLDTLDAIPEAPVEDAETFAANARLKAIGYAVATGVRCIADDSGLCVDCIDGAPGVYSARWAGTGDTRGKRDAANNAKLLEAVSGVPMEERTARFICAMCLADPGGSVLAETEGAFEGLITSEPAGEHGFGYDPLLWLPDMACTSAELLPEQKNARSHRGEAARRMARRLDELNLDSNAS